ncbi:PREDICTED: papilin-like [Papilio polytes]|uniref:papilin-like n=1 Tax=Papilio polytes TaxID=76194 RepID=UPI000675E903|nr:PREDICTED: papilin-like [Papilio polytes]
MKLVSIFVIIYVVKPIEACRRPVMSTGVTKPPGERDWEKWDLPPYNEDWTGFVNLLGTREIKQNKTAAYDSEEDRIKDAPGFPSRWMHVGPGFPGQDPPAKSKVNNYVGQAAYCLDPHDRGTGKTMWYLRWYYDSVRSRCRRFVYSGFGGNANRFISKLACEKDCKHPPRPCCVNEVLIDFEKFLNPHGEPSFG